MATATLTFEPVLAINGRVRNNGTRERFPQREARAKQLFAKATYLGVLPILAANAVVEGKIIKFAGADIAAAPGKHGPATCILCSGTHGKSTKDGPITRADLMQMQTYYKAADGSVFGISDTCRERYLDDKARLLANESAYRGDFPKVPVK